MRTLNTLTRVGLHRKSSGRQWSRVHNRFNPVSRHEQTRAIRALRRGNLRRLDESQKRRSSCNRLKNADLECPACGVVEPRGRRRIDNHEVSSDQRFCREVFGDSAHEVCHVTTIKLNPRRQHVNEFLRKYRFLTGTKNDAAGSPLAPSQNPPRR